MKPITPLSIVILTLLAVIPLTAADVKPPEKPKATPGLVEVHFADDSVLKMLLREEHIDIVTPYGKLRVPFAKIQQIEFATRISPETAKRIDKAIADLAKRRGEGSRPGHRRVAEVEGSCVSGAGRSD